LNGVPIAPGELVAVYGNQIGPSQPVGAELDAAGNVTTELAGYSVTFGGLPAPLLYASSGQINLVTPFGMPTSGDVQVELRQNGTVIGTYYQNVAPQDLGLFAGNTGQLAALNQDGSINSSTNPAHPGDVVSIFATGLGAMTPQPTDGSRPSQPVATPVVPPIVRLQCCEAAAVYYMGNAPDQVQGFVQINFRLPQSMDYFPPGVSPLSVTLIASTPLDGSNEGTIMVQQ
jgi:uncharacterized protein (TIGR03437 family)